MYDRHWPQPPIVTRKTPFIGSFIFVQLRTILAGEQKLRPTAAQLDLTTPSRYVTFRRVTEAARTALTHFATAAQPSLHYPLTAFCNWLHCYVNLFKEPCASCGQLLGQDAALPVLRRVVYNSANQSQIRPYHEHCRAKVPAATNTISAS